MTSQPSPTDGSKGDRVRKEVRYWLARIRNEVDGGCPADGVPAGLREKFEAQPLFQVAGGWMGYRVSWDVGPKGEEMIGLEESQWDAWAKVVVAGAKDLPESTKVAPVREKGKLPFKQTKVVDAMLDIH